MLNENQKNYCEDNGRILETERNSEYGENIRYESTTKLKPNHDCFNVGWTLLFCYIIKIRVTKLCDRKNA